MHAALRNVDVSPIGKYLPREGRNIESRKWEMARPLRCVAVR